MLIWKFLRKEKTWSLKWIVILHVRHWYEEDVRWAWWSVARYNFLTSVVASRRVVAIFRLQRFQNFGKLRGWKILKRCSNEFDCDRKRHTRSYYGKRAKICNGTLCWFSSSLYCQSFLFLLEILLKQIFVHKLFMTFHVRKKIKECLSTTETSQTKFFSRTASIQHHLGVPLYGYFSPHEVTNTKSNFSKTPEIQSMIR